MCPDLLIDRRPSRDARATCRRPRRRQARGAATLRQDEPAGRSRRAVARDRRMAHRARRSRSRQRPHGRRTADRRRLRTAGCELDARASRRAARAARPEHRHDRRSRDGRPAPRHHPRPRPRRRCSTGCWISRKTLHERDRVPDARRVRRVPGPSRRTPRPRRPRAIPDPVPRRRCGLRLCRLGAVDDARALRQARATAVRAGRSARARPTAAG